MKKIYTAPGLLIALLCISSCKQPVKKEASEIKVKYSVPSKEDIVMYEVFVRNFSNEGTFNALTSRLNELKDLGINVLWLMPIQPTGQLNKKGTYGSPYSISNYYEVNPDFGTKADFRRLVDSVHAKGMHIIIDEVANHTSWDHPWISQHPDWYTHDSTGKIIPPVPDWSDVADLNFENTELRKEMIQSMKYWVDTFNIDGYRCDAASMVPNEWWKECIDTLRKIRPLIMLAEADKPEMYANGFDIIYGWEMYHTLKNIWAGKRPIAAIDSVLEKEDSIYPKNHKSLRFITNHDENSWDDLPEVKFTNADGAKAAFITSITLRSTVPLVYNGQEVAYATRINLFEKYNIDWSAQPEIHNWYKSVLHFYNDSKPLEKGSMEMMTGENKDVIMYRRTAGNDQVIVIVNPRNKEVTANIPESLQKKKLIDVFTNEEINFDVTLKMKPFQYHVLKESK